MSVNYYDQLISINSSSNQLINKHDYAPINLVSISPHIFWHFNFIQRYNSNSEVLLTTVSRFTSQLDKLTTKKY